MADYNDYAAACCALLFVLDKAWDAFVAWNEAQIGMCPPREEMKRALVMLDQEYQEAARG